MAKQKSDDFYDLRVAREMAERAAGPLEGNAAGSDQGRDSGYVKFSASRVRQFFTGTQAAPPPGATTPTAEDRGGPAAPAPPPAGPSPDTTSKSSSGVWDSLLDWCAAAAGAESAFAINESGSLIAGRIPGRSGEEIEAIGNRVKIAIQQATRMGISDSEHVFLDLGLSWMSGLPVRLLSGEIVAVCVVGGPWQLQEDTCLRIRHGVKKALS